MTRTNDDTVKNTQSKLAYYGLMTTLILLLRAYPSDEKTLAWGTFLLSLRMAYKHKHLDKRAFFMLAFYGLCLTGVNKSEEMGRLPVLLSIALSVAFFKHQVPGFNNLCVIKNKKLSDHSSAYTMWWNMDKVCAGILPAMILTTNKEVSPHFLTQRTAIYSLFSLFVSVFPGYGLGLLKIDLGLKKQAMIWMLTNFLFVSACEEIMVRLLWQKGLNQFFESSHATIAANLLFAAMHVQKANVTSLILGILTFGAATGYAMAFEETNHILSATCAHFLLNLAHRLVFTYPSIDKLQRTPTLTQE